MQHRSIKLLLIALPVVALAGCGKAHVGYSPLPNVNVSVPVSLPGGGGSSGGRLPSGNGGYYKTGKPYQVAGKWYHPLQSAAGYEATGTASWYGSDFHSKKTANGERYDMYAMSAAHKTLPLPSLVRVTNLENGRSVVVRVNDRGPFVKDRLIDLSYAAARELGFEAQGTTRVRVEVIGNGDPATISASAAAAAPNPQPVVAQQAPPVEPVTTHAATPASGALFIQLGAFSSQMNAQRLQSELAASHPTAQVYPDHRSSPGIYRVRIGPFRNVQEIESLVISLQQQGYAQAIVVIE